MRIGPLQKYILLVSRSKRGWIDRDTFLDYYHGAKVKPKMDDRINAITKAFEKLIRQNLLVANGVKTSEKFFIISIKLTTEGRRAARAIIGSQQRLPIKTEK